MDWKVSLDKYLTSGPPDNGYDDFFEEIGNNLSDDFFYKNEDWLIDSFQCDKWTSKLFSKGYSPFEAALILERAFNLYIKGRI
jgi:hypothetical protein